MSQSAEKAFAGEGEFFTVKCPRGAYLYFASTMKNQPTLLISPT